MVLSPTEARQEVLGLLPYYLNEKARLDKIDRYLRGEHDAPYQPKTPNSEYKLLIKRAVSNWLPLIVDTFAQSLYVEGYRSADSDSNAAGWQTWQVNGMDSRQGAVHRAALTYGTAYTVGMPGDTEAVLRGASPRRMMAFYEDPAEDDWPVQALRVKPCKGGFNVQLIDDTTVYEFRLSTLEDKDPQWVGAAMHELGFCPVVRFSEELDLEGRSRGLIEPLYPVQDRLNQTIFDLLLAQTYGAFKIRTVSGLEMPGSVEDGATAEEIAAANLARRSRQMEIAANRFLTSDDPNTKWGTLDETPLDGFISALDTTVRHMAAITQVPPSYLLGEMANLSAEALASAEAGKDRKTEDYKHSFGESWEQSFRMTAAINGDSAGASDVHSEVIWRDTGARSFAATVDALGKAATMLQVPPEALWAKIPGVTQNEVDEWKRLRASGDPLTALASQLSSQSS